VLGDIASLREIWGDAALYVSPNDPKALQSALTRLIDDAPLRTRLARRARARALHFSAERMAAGIWPPIRGCCARATRNGRQPR
jgi:glycosyltransferase involved in cell wall biosynthesis